MSMMEEFKTFALKGNVMDLAVGVIIGGGLDFANYYLPLNGQGTQLTLIEAKKAGAALSNEQVKPIAVITGGAPI